MYYRYRCGVARIAKIEREWATLPEFFIVSLVASIVGLVSIFGNIRDSGERRKSE
jgi:hypothetical protein